MKRYSEEKEDDTKNNKTSVATRSITTLLQPYYEYVIKEYIKVSYVWQ